MQKPPFCDARPRFSAILNSASNAERGAPAQNTPFIKPQLYALNMPIWTQGNVLPKSVVVVVSQKQNSRCVKCASTAHLISSEVFHLNSQWSGAVCHERFRPLP
jgi:hypothetical protein